MAKKKQRAKPAPPPSASEQMDRELAGSALDKRRRGVTPNTQELAALRRIEQQREEELRWDYYRTIPQKHWREMSGRQAKVINEQADRYQLPFDGAKVDLPAVVKALHNFLAEHGRKLLDDAGELTPESTSPMLERIREEDWRLKRVKRLLAEGQVLPRGVVHDWFSQVAGLLRKAGELLEKQFGPEALEIHDKALASAERLITDGLDNIEQVPQESPESEVGLDARGEAGVSLAGEKQPQAQGEDNPRVRRARDRSA